MATCLLCGKTRSLRARHFCSKECSSEWARTHGVGGQGGTVPSYDYSDIDPEDQLYGDDYQPVGERVPVNGLYDGLSVRPFSDGPSEHRRVSLDDASESEPDGPGERPSAGLSEPSDLESSHDVASEVDPSPSAPRVTRHEASESHHGVSLTSLTARVDEDGDLLILAEVHALESGELPDDVEIVFVIKDQNGDILQMTERLLTKDRFHTLDVLRVWFFGHGRNTCEVLVFARAG